VPRASLLPALVVGVLCAGLASACSPVAVPPGGTGEPGTAAADGTDRAPVRVVAVGDSLTAGGRGLLSDGLDADTWLTYAVGDDVAWVGGWAKGGSTTQEQADAVSPVPDADVLVLLSGTNDVRRGLTFDRSAAAYDSVVATVGAEHVVVAAIPPWERDPGAADRFDRALEVHALRRGWTFVDPWTFLRDGVHFAPGTSPDGIHPTTEGYARLGRELRVAILAAGAPEPDALAAPGTAPGTASR